jgi:putative ATPase
VNTLLFSQPLSPALLLEIVQGNITEQAVDAIVNAANSRLQHGGGVAGAIARRGGPSIQAESDAWVREHGPVSHAQPAWTGAGSLPCRFIIHAVGPMWGEGDEDRKLAGCIRGSLDAAAQLKLSSLALPAISTGIFGFPKERAARITLDTLRAWAAEHPESAVSLVRLTIIDQPTLNVYLEAAR